MKGNGSSNQRRRYNRVAVSGKVRYQYSRQEGGNASLTDVDHSGLCMLSERPLQRGQRLMMDVADPGTANHFFEMKGVVIWVKPGAMPGTWRVGVRVYLDEPDTRIALCALMCAGLKKAAAVAELRDKHFLFVEWKLATLEVSEAVADARNVWCKPAKRAQSGIRATAPVF